MTAEETLQTFMDGAFGPNGLAAIGALTLDHTPEQQEALNAQIKSFAALLEEPRFQRLQVMQSSNAVAGVYRIEATAIASGRTVETTCQIWLTLQAEQVVQAFIHLDHLALCAEGTETVQHLSGLCVDV